MRVALAYRNPHRVECPATSLKRFADLEVKSAAAFADTVVEANVNARFEFKAVANAPEGSQRPLFSDDSEGPMVPAPAQATIPCRQVSCRRYSSWLLKTFLSR